MSSKIQQQQTINFHGSWRNLYSSRVSLNVSRVSLHFSWTIIVATAPKLYAEPPKTIEWRSPNLQNKFHSSWISLYYLRVRIALKSTVD
jgi:hypothetical protein